LNCGSNGNSNNTSTTNTATTTSSASTTTLTNDTNDVELDDWQDITDQDAIQPNHEYDDNDDDIQLSDIEQSKNTTTYALDTNRRASIDLGHLSINVHDESIQINNTNNATSGMGNTSTRSLISNLLDSSMNNPNKRQRYRQPSIASISEEEPALLGPTNYNNNNNNNTMEDEDDEVATVDGNIDEDNDMEDIE
jgi:triacylglycerol esterase/lipase EstA (alpha/beta hydrolase family)